MKKILLFLLCLTAFFAKAQTKQIDSLLSRLKEIKNIKEKPPIYDALVRSYINIDIEKSTQYNDSLKHYGKIKKDKEREMTAMYNSAVIERMKGNYQKSKDHLSNYLTYAKDKNDSIILCRVFFQLGSANIFLGEKEEAITNYINSLSYLETSNNSRLKAKTLNGIAVTYAQIKQHEKSKEYNFKAAQMANKAKDLNQLGVIYNGLGISFKRQDSIKKALDYFKKSLAIGKKTNNLRLMGYQYRNIGEIYGLEKNYKEAEFYFKKSLKIRRQIGNTQVIAGNLSDLASLYINTNRFKKAQRYLDDANDIFKENNTIVEQTAMLYYYGLLEVKKGNVDKAIEYLNKHKNTNDSINNVSLLERVNEIDVKYQTEKKDRELAQQKLAIETKDFELQKKKSQNTFIAGLAIFFFITSILTWFLYQQRQQRKNQEILTLKREQQVKTLESLMEGEEKERLRIAKELHDGVNVDLSAIKYKLTSLLEKNDIVINEAVAMIDKSCEQVRAISHNLVPPSLKDFSLLEAIEDYCGTMNSIHEPKISFQHIGEPISFSKKVEVNIFRIIQELVNNSIKHAQATEIDIQISHRDQIIQLTVEDNGVGFKGEAIESDGIGLQNIQSRVEYLKAKLDFNTGTEGTSYIIEINTNDLV